MTSLTEKLAETVPLGMKLSYGPVMTVDGTELVPVSIVSYGFGGGSGGGGTEVEPDGFGSGGGGGGSSIPIGAYIGGPDGLRFRPNIIALLAVSVPVIWVAGHALGRVLKAVR
jgi:uncharacterized spore protein YtfJ